MSMASLGLLLDAPRASSALASSTSDRSDLTSMTMKLNFPKSNIDVNLSNHFSSKIYTSSSPVTGDVTITTKRDVRFDSVQILLVGNTKTRIDGVNAPKEVTHTFLKMIMPVPESAYPVPRVLETGQTYTIPFNFVIPNQLTINACNHQMLSSSLQDHHVLLPPSMGRWEKDDLSPDMARVEYLIKARVLRQDDLHGRSVRIMEDAKPIRVLPASAEEPPLSVGEHDRLYTMSKTKSVRRNMLSSKLGRLTAEATQPSPAVLRADGLGMVSQPTARVSLRFEPVSPDVQPPKITGVSGKIIAHTFYSSSTIASFPNLGGWNQQFGAERRGAYSTSVALPTLSAPGARWAQQVLSVRRDSGYSSDTDSAKNNGRQSDSERSSKDIKTNKRWSKHTSATSVADSSLSPIHHIAALEIPIPLPVDKKTFIPTFHSCIASRVYALQLAVQVSIGSATSTVQLTLPLQVAIQSDIQQHGGLALPSFEAAVAESEADAHLRPRVLAVPERQFVETSVLPGYR